MKKRFVFFLVSLLLISYAKADNSSMLAGFSKVNITSPDAGALHDSLYARVLILENEGKRIGFISVDQAIYTSEQIQEIAKKQFNISHLLLASSHTHSGGGRGKAADFIQNRLTEALKEATSNLFPAKISAGHRDFPQLGFNRLIVREDGHSRESWFADEHYTFENPERIPFGPVDSEVGVIKIEDMDGQTRGIIMNYACHADVVCFNHEISGDYPGVACRKVEEAFDNKVTCLFVQGAAGDIAPLLISSRRNGPDDPFKSDYRMIERMGELLAWEAVKLTRSLSSACEPQTGFKVMTDSFNFGGRIQKDVQYNVHISTILLNDHIAIASCPGEFMIRLQLEWKKKMRDANATPFLFGYTWFAGRWPGYVPDIKAAAQGGYGADQNPAAIEVGSGERMMNKHFENYFLLTGLMRTEPGPVGFKGGSRWQIIELKD